ncbi:MAG: serine--tRNA ligase [Armatimonadetes bacterium]|nr:serine--tRNA ligase [Armatimonadota bacterium]
MLDIRLIREQTDFVKNGLNRLGAPTDIIDTILELDRRKRRLLTDVESLKGERNSVSKTIPRITDSAERERKIAEMRQLGERIASLDAEVQSVDATLQKRMLEVPNLPHEGTPLGLNESDNVVVRQIGDPRAFDFAPKPHWELGEKLGILDIARGVKISGSRFYILKGAGAALQRALIAFMLDVHIREHGYTEVYPPFMVREECLYGTGNLPKFGDNLYHDVEDDLWLIPTAEVPVTNLYREEILEADLLPIRHVAYSSCFRRERMSAGRDVRGIKRGHQFDKVEMVKFVEPLQSDAELESLVADAEDICRRLEIPHRVVQMCTADLSFSAAMKYDIEIWASRAGGEEGEWLEVSSCSNFRDFQARRAGIRYRPSKGARPEYVHTLNGSGLALPRTLIAVIENYQNEDGSITVPAALKPYLNGLCKLEGE